MSEVLDAVRKKYPQYADVPDDKLTAALGEKYPAYLDRPDFAAEHRAVKQQQAGREIEAVNPWARHTFPEAFPQQVDSLSPVGSAEELEPAPPAEPKKLNPNLEVMRMRNSSGGFVLNADAPHLSPELRETIKSIQFEPPPGIAQRDFTDEESGLILKRWHAEEKAAADRMYYESGLGKSPLDLLDPYFETISYLGSKPMQQVVGFSEAVLGVPKFLTSVGGIMQLPAFGHPVGRVYYGAEMLKGAYDASQELAVELAKPEADRDHYRVGQLQGAMVFNTMFGVGLLGREAGRAGKAGVQKVLPKIGLDKLSEELTRARTLPDYQAIVDKLKPQFGDKEPGLYKRRPMNWGTSPSTIKPPPSTALETPPPSGQPGLPIVPGAPNLNVNVPGDSPQKGVLPGQTVQTEYGPGTVKGIEHGGELVDVALHNGQNRTMRPDQISKEPGTAPAGLSASPLGEQPPVPPEIPTESNLVGVPVRQVPRGQIATRPDLMQFKRMDEAVTGVNEADKLAGQWDDLKAGNLLLWEPADPKAHGLAEGQKYIVANGHHRFEFGERQTVPAFNAQIVREADGFSAGDARRLAAEINIADGKGTIYDQTKFIRNTAATHGADEALAAARRIGAKGRKASNIALAASDPLYDSFINEQISADHADAIASAAPRNEPAQRLGLKAALAGKSVDFSENLVKAALSESGGNAKELDLFGNDDTAMQAMEAQADRASKFQRELREQISAISGATKRPEIARKLGVDVKDPAAVAAKLQELRGEQARWDNWPMQPDLVGKVRGEQSEASPDFGGDFFDKVETVAEQKARLEREKQLAETNRKAQELSERANEALKGTTGDLGQKEMFGGGDLFSEASPPIGPGGEIGGQPPRRPAPADDPGFTAFPVELPEAVIFARDLLGGIYPRVVEKLRALGGRAAGVFRYTQGEGGKGRIELKAATADLLTGAEKAALRAEANDYARHHTEPGRNAKDVAEERYKFLERQAYEEAKTRAPLQALKVLWHEIGHAVDWLPDKVIHGRGNLFGRIASLKNYLKRTIALDPTKPSGPPLTARDRAELLKEAERLIREEIGPIREIVRTIISEEPEYRIAGVTPEDVKNLFGMDAREAQPELYRWFAEQSAEVKKVIVKAAMKGLVDERLAALGKREQIGTRRVERTVREKVGREPTVAEIQERFRELLRAEIRKRNLAEITAVRQELEGAIAWWRGTPKMEEYFRTGSEMFAESFSIFMNNPAALQKRAPIFSRLLWNYLSARPEVKALYDQVQADIRTGAVETKRVNELLRSFSEDDRASLHRDRERLVRGDALDNVRYHIDRRFGPIFASVKGSDMEGPVQKAVGDFLYRQAEHELTLNQTNNRVGVPMAEGNLDWHWLGEYMFHQRVVNERFKIFNPLGWNPKNSLERLAEMERQLGHERWAALERSHAGLRKIYEEHIPQNPEASHYFPAELLPAIESNIWYGTFAVRKGAPEAGIERLLAANLGPDIGPHVFRQVGTVKEIKNPATATILKMLSLESAMARNAAKRITIDALKQTEPINIKLADQRWTGQRREWVIRDGPAAGTVVFMRNGKPEAYYVRKVVADALNKNTAIENILVQHAVGAVGWLKGLYTQLNYGFWPFNFVRDTAAWWMQMPGVGTPIGWAVRLPRAVAAARASVKGRPNVAAEQALARRMVISRADPRGTWAAAENQYEARLASYGLDPVAWKSEADKVHSLVKSWNWYRELGQTVERSNKIAAMLYLDEKFPSMPEWKKRQIVRERGGSPDFLQRGASNPYIDFFAMFYNPWKESIRSVSRSARENPWSFAAKTTAFVVAPTVAQALASSGAFGDEVKKQYESIPDYDLTNYLNVPVGWEDREQGRVVYWRLPLWEPARVMHGGLWQWLTGRGRGVGQFYAGTLPSINSLLDTFWAWKEFEFAGHNPYDSFTGKNWLSEKQFAAGGWDARKELLKRTWNNFGGGLFGRFRNDQLNSPPQSDVMKFLNLPVINNALGRWVKVSDRGLADADRRLSILPDEQRRAQIQLAAGEIMRKILDHEELSPKERQLMRDPYALQYVSETLPQLAAQRASPLYRRTQAAGTIPARVDILQRALSDTNTPPR